jgi:hypothetical protein
MNSGVSDLAREVREKIETDRVEAHMRRYRFASE